MPHRYRSICFQAVFRFLRVIYPMQQCLRYFRNYLAVIVSIWFLSFLLLLPIHFWQDIQLNSNENVCLLVLHSPRGLIWTTLVIFGLPMAIIISIYVYLIRAVGRSSIRRASNIKQDLKVVRRIVLVIMVLASICGPFGHSRVFTSFHAFWFPVLFLSDFKRDDGRRHAPPQSHADSCDAPSEGQCLVSDTRTSSVASRSTAAHCHCHCGVPSILSIRSYHACVTIPKNQQ